MPSTDAVWAATITGITWLTWAILARFILPDFPRYVMTLGLGVCFFILPIGNHVGIFIAIRRHNNQVADAVSSAQNASVLFRREKKAAMDMFIVIIVLFLCLAPGVVVNIFSFLFPEEFEVLFVWSTALAYINSAINPVIYLVRSCEVRNAVRSMMCF